jgi:predicted transcriptional regulator of viral defense system/very-short-patch-repair endonuclease
MDWNRLVETQHGAFSLTQARAAGRDSAWLTRHVRAGRLDRGLPGVYLVGGSPRTRSQRVNEVLLWAGPDACLSHTTAAHFLGLDVAEHTTVHVTTPRNLRPDEKWIKVHRLSLPSCDVTQVRGLQMTTMPRTVIDVASLMEEEALDIALDSAIRQGMPRATFLARFAEVSRARRPGTAVLRRLIEERETEQGLPGSAFERRLLRLIRKQGLPLPVSQYPISTDTMRAFIDFAYPEFGVAIEADGYRWHGGRAAFERDRRRSSELASWGWRILHITWLQLKYEHERVAARIRRALSTPGVTSLRS